MKTTPFQEFYKEKLKKETLTPEEFQEMVTDYLLGFNYYIADPVGGNQARRIILDDIIKAHPQKLSRKSVDKEWLSFYKQQLFEMDRRDEECKTNI